MVKTYIWSGVVAALLIAPAGTGLAAVSHPGQAAGKPGLVIHSVYNGYWFWGRPSFCDLWHDLRAATAEIRPDWDLSTPGLREAWDAGDYSKFHGWDQRSAESMPTSLQVLSRRAIAYAGNRRSPQVPSDR